LHRPAAEGSQVEDFAAQRGRNGILIRKIVKCLAIKNRSGKFQSEAGAQREK